MEKTEIHGCERRVENYRKKAECFIEYRTRKMMEHCLHGVPLNMSEIYAGRESLISRDAISDVLYLAERAGSALEAKRLLYFANFLLRECVRKGTADIADRITEVKNAPLVQFDNKRLSCNGLKRAIAFERDYEKRRVLNDGALPVLEKLNPLYLHKKELETELFAGLGFESVGAYRERLFGKKSADIISVCSGLLNGTDSAYRKVLPVMSERNADIGAGELRPCDIGRLVRSPASGRIGTAGDAVSAVFGTFEALNIDREELKSITIHAGDHPLKNHRPCCFPVRVPEEIYVSAGTGGPVSGFRALLHEMGHAAHFALTDTGVFEFRRLGGSALTELFAFLFESLFEYHDWLSGFVTKNKSESLSQKHAAAFEKLFLIRRHAAVILSAVKMDGDSAGGRDVYAHYLEKAFGFPLSEVDKEYYLADREELPVSIYYVEAWLACAGLLDWLENQFGGSWFGNPEAGDFIRSIMNRGTECSIHELPSSAAGNAPGYEVFIRRSHRALDDM